MVSSSLLMFQKKLLQNSFLHYYFEKQIYTFFLKLRTKKIITIFTFMLQIKNALKHKLPLTFFYSKQIFLRLLKIYKAEHLIVNYFLIPPEIFPTFLQCTIEKKFLSRAVCILFPSASLFSREASFKEVIFISKPSRKIFISFIQLLKLVRRLQVTIILSTNFGILTHREALVKKCGGLLLCFLK